MADTRRAELCGEWGRVGGPGRGAAAIHRTSQNWGEKAFVQAPKTVLIKPWRAARAVWRGAPAPLAALGGAHNHRCARVQSPRENRTRILTQVFLVREKPKT
eukprot:scaffold68395_cov69-Phaeocystis_antarctica.AAC.2